MTDGMRKLYESANDRQNEARLARTIEAARGVTLKKLGIKYGLDYIALKNDVAVGAVEVKARRNAFEDYDTVILSLDKYQHAMKFVSMGLPVILVFGFTDRPDGMFHTLSGKVHDIKWFAGRNDRDDKQDAEPVVHIPRSAWRPLPTPV